MAAVRDSGVSGSVSPLINHVLPDGTRLPGCRSDLLNISDFLSRNWSIIPLRPRQKVPAIRWEAYQRRHAFADELEQFFSTPGFNVGIVTGRVSGIFVIDLDSPEAITWAADHLPPCNLRVRTAKGIHYYFDYSGDRPMRNKVKVRVGGVQRDLDIRADGGFVVGPGSVHPSGFVYAREGAGWA